MKNEGFHIILMDIQIPEMDGEEATVAIPDLPPPNNVIPIPALTADIMPEHQASYHGAGVNDLGIGNRSIDTLGKMRPPSSHSPALPVQILADITPALRIGKHYIRQEEISLCYMAFDGHFLGLST